MRLGKLAFISSSLLITLSTSIPTVAQAAQNTPTPGAPPASASIDVPDTQVQTLHVTSREVIVDVMVTGKDGQPVYGLQQSDFSIEENGHHQAIRSFREYTASTPIDDPAQASPGRLHQQPGDARQRPRQRHPARRPSLRRNDHDPLAQ